MTRGSITSHQLLLVNSGAYAMYSEMRCPEELMGVIAVL